MSLLDKVNSAAEALGIQANKTAAKQTKNLTIKILQFKYSLMIDISASISRHALGFSRHTKLCTSILTTLQPITLVVGDEKVIGFVDSLWVTVYPYSSAHLH